MGIWKANPKNKNLLYLLFLYIFFISFTNCQLIKLDGQKINTNYILYVLKGLYIYGKNDAPYILLGEKKDMNNAGPHAIFENVGISTNEIKNTKYFSFGMKHDSHHDDNINEKHNEDGEAEKAKNHNHNSYDDDDDESDENNKKKGFKLNLYKDNPYVQRKTEHSETKSWNSNDNTSDLFLEIIIMKETDFNKLYLPKDTNMCCYTKMTGFDNSDKYTCPGKGYLKRYLDESEMHSLKVPIYFINDRIEDNDTSSGNEVNHNKFLELIKNEHVFNIDKTDIYTVFISNCGDSKIYELELHGNIHILNKYGYLPGDKITKLNLYVSLMIIYLLYSIIWSYSLFKNKTNVIKIQVWISVCMLLYLIENIFLYLYFMTYNVQAKINNNYLFMAVFFSVLKNVCSYLLILLGSLGWGLVIPTLDKKTFIKIKVLFIFFIIFDFIKQLLDAHLAEEHVNTVYFLCCILPMSIIYSIIYMWVFISSSKIIIQLNEDKQYEKLNMFKNFFNVLILALVFSIISLIIDLFVMMFPNEQLWNLKCYISEGVNSCLFLTVLTAMCVLFKPSERLKRISHFTEIGDMDEMDDFSHFKNSIEDVP
ncbi:serpentine receptor, putative [Plasmodium chabaudi chabaudi]|uniref:Serpentine receptor, putative n=1 Tax=Plasmodium chabaudi chabaudi TaxID=31271 RepID=A0A1C6YSI0_PLACU|nr:serpentine receptor, putative [Plasmodium chabaudi chabaudi]